MVVQINGRQMYLWRTVDDEGEVLEVLIQSRKNKAAALKLIRRLLRKQSYSYRHSAQAVEMHTLTSRILINCHTMNGVSNEPLSSGL